MQTRFVCLHQHTTGVHRRARVLSPRQSHRRPPTVLNQSSTDYSNKITANLGIRGLGTLAHYLVGKGGEEETKSKKRWVAKGRDRPLGPADASPRGHLTNGEGGKEQGGGQTECRRRLSSIIHQPVSSFILLMGDKMGHPPPPPASFLLSLAGSPHRLSLWGILDTACPPCSFG